MEAHRFCLNLNIDDKKNLIPTVKSLKLHTDNSEIEKKIINKLISIKENVFKNNFNNNLLKKPLKHKDT